ncbi:MAG TPA: DUF4352 domain-containing protein [Candidatus Marinimicrobia bacterium]|jgi:hypothetical protein|nr:DUF4352 domain-containing protein [Candidatus Neomarinimicrobiota bacterium]HJL77715.1 DUF4352 domain-containing protein [Candidatus Neomarinimicrobiota bacterium]|tara:strand:+ start:485 stop:1072 length:588 start_codon:yes stop_codon:yes gene_type:complete
MNCRKINRLIPFFIFLFSLPVAAQVTKVSKNSDIFVKPGGKAIGELNESAKITKLGKDKSGKYIKATIEFYILAEALKESRIAGTIGDTQTTGKASISLLSAKKNAKTVTISVKIKNSGKNNFDMSAMMLFVVMDGKSKPGSLDIMKSKNSIGIIKPGRSMNSELVYTFTKDPKDVEMAFQSKLGGDQVYFMLGF